MTPHNPDNARHIAGAMSGTSADGVDIAITRITGRGTDMSATLVKHHHQPYTTELRAEIFAFRAGEVRENVLSRLAQMGRAISLTYASAINEALQAASMQADMLSAVAAHGQTLFHDPPNTIQWFDPTIVAAEVGCPVVSDFRRADLAAGGQGAPLVPFADYILFRHPTKNRVLLNIGGIANLTYLKAGGQFDEVMAFDTGPGNCISDYLCRKFEPTGPGYDIGGAIALSGTVNAKILPRMLAPGSYFTKRPPKSTDGPEMIAMYEAALASSGESPSLADQLATAIHVTAEGIKLAIRNFSVDEILVSGGGSENRAIAKCFNGFPWQVVPESNAKEALAFALLGAATLEGEPSNVPSVTGAKRAVVLGSITPKP